MLKLLASRDVLREWTHTRKCVQPCLFLPHCPATLILSLFVVWFWFFLETESHYITLKFLEFWYRETVGPCISSVSPRNPASTISSHSLAVDLWAYHDIFRFWILFSVVHSEKCPVHNFPSIRDTFICILDDSTHFWKNLWLWDLNPGPYTCRTHTLPLTSIPILNPHIFLNPLLLLFLYLLFYFVTPVKNMKKVSFFIHICLIDFCQIHDYEDSEALELTKEKCKATPIIQRGSFWKQKNAFSTNSYLTIKR